MIILADFGNVGIQEIVLRHEGLPLLKKPNQMAGGSYRREGGMEKGEREEQEVGKGKDVQKRRKRGRVIYVQYNYTQESVREGDPER